MQNTPTAHNQAKLGEIAKTVLMPGDPLRAKFIAETYLEDVQQYNSVRGMLGFTGTYQGKPVSVQGHGMGCASIGIYSYELYHFYEVERIIRVGSAGAISDTLNLGDIVIAMSASSDSNYASQYQLPGVYAPNADFALLEQAVAAAREQGISFQVGNLLSSDFFYGDDADSLKKWKKMGVLAVEMESYALYCNAARAGKQALCITTISDCPLRGLSMSAEDRQLGFGRMIKLALGTLK